MSKKSPDSGDFATFRVLYDTHVPPPISTALAALLINSLQHDTKSHLTGPWPPVWPSAVKPHPVHPTASRMFFLKGKYGRITPLLTLSLCLSIASGMRLGLLCAAPTLSLLICPASPPCPAFLQLLHTVRISQTWECWLSAHTHLSLCLSAAPVPSILSSPGPSFAHPARPPAG